MEDEINLNDTKNCLEYLKNEYDRAIEREKTLEYKLEILWSTIIFIITNTREILFSKEILFVIFFNKSYFVNLDLIFRILILGIILSISYFSYNILKLSAVFRASTYLEYLSEILDFEEKIQQLFLIAIYCDMNKNRDKRCDYKSKNLNNAIKAFGTFLILILIIYLIEYGG